jgi:YfiH family protein
VDCAAHAAFTLRAGGVSAGRYASLNLGKHVGDDAAHVAENRRRVREQLNLPGEPVWLEQLHGSGVLRADTIDDRSSRTADALYTRAAGTVCAIQVADCMPVLFASADGAVVAAAHAGWRGLAAGVLEATIEALGVTAPQLDVWLGPAISQAHFEVGEEVRAAFLAHDAQAAAAFVRNPRGRWQCDLYRLAQQRLVARGVTRICGGGFCTHADSARFFSHRREAPTGRMAALIWRGAPGR